jgi:hypothetical protein
MTDTQWRFWLFLNCTTKKEELFHLLAFKNSFLVESEWSVEECFFIPLLLHKFIDRYVLSLKFFFLYYCLFTFLNSSLLWCACSHHYIILLSHVQHISALL